MTPGPSLDPPMHEMHFGQILGFSHVMYTVPRVHFGLPLLQVARDILISKASFKDILWFELVDLSVP